MVIMGVAGPKCAHACTISINTYGDIWVCMLTAIGLRLCGQLAQRLARIRGMAALNPLVVFVLGGPGAGKGTQCAKIVQVSVTRTTARRAGIDGFLVWR